MKLAKSLLAVAFLTLLVHSPAASRVPSFPGDDAFVNMDYQTAERQYDSILCVIVPHPDLFWRLARLHVAMGDVAEENGRMEHYLSAEEYARHSILLVLVKNF